MPARLLAHLIRYLAPNLSDGSRRLDLPTLEIRRFTANGPNWRLSPLGWGPRRSLLTLALIGLGLLATALAVTAQPRGISRVAPHPGSTGVYAGSEIQIHFSQSMNTTSVESAFEVDPPIGGEFVWRNNQSLAYQPSEPFALVTEYRVTLGVGALDARGNPILTEPFSWTFTTWDTDPVGRLGRSLPLVVVPATDVQTVAFDNAYPRMSLDLAVYTLTPGQFATRMDDVTPYENPDLDVDGLTRQDLGSVDLDRTRGGLELPGVAPGLYILEAASPRVGTARALLVVSDYGLVGKQGTAGLTLWATHVSDGTLAGNAPIQALDAEGEPVAATTTDASGVGRIAAPEAVLVYGRVGGQPAILGFDRFWQTRDNYFWRGQWEAAGPPSFVGHMHTDRPIYRPGDTVHYKATVRQVQADGLGLPPTEPYTVTIRDGGDNVVVETPASLDAFGSLQGDVDLADEVALGQWRFEVAGPEGRLAGTFQVQEYVKPDYEVTVETDRPWYVTGQTAQIDVGADYYFGQPVTAADAVVRVYENTWGSDQPLSTVEGQTDTSGKFATSVTLPTTSHSRAVLIEAEVTDASRRPVNAGTTVMVHPAEFNLRLRNARYGVEVGEPVRLTAEVIDHDGNPVPNQSVQAEVRQYQYRVGYEVVSTETVQTDAAGTASLTFSGLKPGWFQISAEARDSGGRQVEAHSYAWITDASRPWYWADPMEITPDKNSYQVGDTATLLVKSPITGTALVTLERDDVYDESVVDLGAATPISFEITDAHVPSVKARVHIWRTDTNVGGQLEIAEVQIPVEASSRRLDVNITSDASQYEPGDTATLRFVVTDASGAPANAQMSVAVVDKAVLALAEDTSGPIFNAFWGPREGTVRTYDSFRPNDYWYGGPEFGDDRGAPGAPGTPAPTPAAGGQDEENQTATPRREFEDTAFWTADLTTAPDGTAEVQLKLPDNLTTWVVVVRAVTVDTRVGEADHELLVTKAIISDPALPRFAVQGDRFALDLLARNYAGGSLSADCMVEAPGLTVLDPGDRTLELPFNETRAARWSVVASDVGTGLVTGTVATSAGTDIIELPLEVQPFTIPDRFVDSGSTTDTTEHTYTVPFDAVPESSTVELRLAPALALGVLDGLEDLIGYPYGCVEQTMSRVLPNAVVDRLLLELDLEIPEISEPLPDMVAKGLQRLYGFQNTDGSWGWWHGEGNVHTTAYVLHGLSLINQTGHQVDSTVLQSGFTWLEANLAAESDPRIRAYGVYVMAEAGRGDVDATRGLADELDRLDSFSVAALAVASESVGLDAQAEALLDRLEAGATTTATTAHWPMNLPTGDRWEPYHWRTMASTEKNTGMALQALARLRADSPLAPKAARWLMEHRWGPGWRSTQATAFAVLGLTDWIVASGELWSTYDWDVSVDGASVASGQVDRSNILDRIPPIELEGDALAAGDHGLAITVDGDGTLYHTLVGQLARYHEGFAATAPEELGIRVRREYLATETEGSGTWAPGDLINVRLTVQVDDDIWYAIVEDQLPAGFEAINQGLDTERQKVPGAEPDFPWRWWGYERKEIRDDRVTFFATRLHAGTHEFDYAVRAVTPGEFSAQPAEAYAMYRPEVWGRSASDLVEIKPEAVAERPPLAGDFDRDCRLTPFDASLAADAWSDSSVRRDSNGDGRQDVADVVTSAGRSGAACGDTVTSPDTPDGSVNLSLRPGETPGTWEVVATGSAGTTLGGVDLWLELPDGAEVTSTAPGTAADVSVNLGHVQANGRLRIGYAGTLSASGGPGVVLATVALEGGDTSPTVDRAVVTDRAGGKYRLTLDGEPLRPAAGRIFLPAVFR